MAARALHRISAAQPAAQSSRIPRPPTPARSLGALGVGPKGRGEAGWVVRPRMQRAGEYRDTLLEVSGAAEVLEGCAGDRGVMLALGAIKPVCARQLVVGERGI